MKAASYEVPAWSVDGMDVLAVADAAHAAVSAVRGGGGPYFLEFKTYRFSPHSMFDAELYRSKDEVSEWRKRDPIDHFIKVMGDTVTPSDIEAIEEEVASEIEDAVVFAEQGTLEPVADLTRFVYSEVAS